MKIPLKHSDDKKLLEGLVEALSISKNNLRKDELGYWNLFGRRGKISTDSIYWYVYVSCASKTIWKNVKSALKTMVLWQDGDEEGVLRLQRHPTEEEAQKIRKILGFTKTRKYTEIEKKELLERLK